MIAMGRNLCLPSRATVSELFSVARDASIIPDISLDPILTSLLSLESSETLQHHFKFLERNLNEDQWRNFTHSLTSQLGGRRVTYGGVGVIALALSMLFDLLARQVQVPSSATGGPSPTKRIFGISRSSRIGWLVHSYLQQVPKMANEQNRVAETTELYDILLKRELLDHFERMINKKRMSSESMRQWLMGSVVHLHMRIHQVRLHSVPFGSAMSLRLSYKTGLSLLMQNYEVYLRRNIKETPAMAPTRPEERTGSGGGDMAFTCSGGEGLSDGPHRVGGLNVTAVNTTLNNSSTHTPNDPSARGGLRASAAGSQKAANCSGNPQQDRRGRLGLLVIEPQRNVSHGVQHHPCQSPAIQQALVTRIISAQDLQQSINMHSLFRQRQDFDFSSP